MKGRNKVIADLNRPNSLFLSAAAQGDHPQLSLIYDWFASRVWGASPSINNEKLQKKISEASDERLIPFLRHADTGILSANISSESPPESVRAVFRSIKDVIKQHALEDGNEVAVQDLDETTTVTLSHSARGGTAVELPFTMESRGTRRLIDILLQAFKTLDTGGVLFVDELDASLHTLLGMKLLELFSDATINKKAAQLIATTHDTNILCAPQVRRDQIWFTEKDAEGATTLFPLTDIRTRNTDNLEKGYLQGRFGAIPFIRPVKDLLLARSNG